MRITAVVNRVEDDSCIKASVYFLGGVSFPTRPRYYEVNFMYLENCVLYKNCVLLWASDVVVFKIFFPVLPITHNMWCGTALPYV